MAKQYSISNFKFLTNCPLCGNPYDVKKIRILNKQDNLIIFHLTCQNCNSSVMVAVSAGVFGITAVSILTDIIGEDLARLNGLDKISADDAIEMHEFLENFSGKFTEVVNKI